MANDRYSYNGYGMPSIDFSPLGELGNVYRQGQNQRTLQDLGPMLQSGDLSGAAAIAAQGGDPRLALQLSQAMEARQQHGASNSRQAEEFAFRKEEAQRAQGNADRTFGLQQQQADAAAKGFDYREIDDGNGNKSLVRIEKATGNVTRPQIEGLQTEPPNPYAPTGKLTENESKDRLYANRTVAAHKIITGLEDINDTTSGFLGGVAENAKIPGAGQVRDSVVFNSAASPDRQKYVQAQRDFINAVLRKESGAAISPSEFENARRQYFPMPGDKPEVLQQKRMNRMTEIEGLMGGAGRGYKPPPGYVGTKDAAPAEAKAVAPKLGEVREGYRFKGGDPGNPQSWVKQ